MRERCVVQERSKLRAVAMRSTVQVNWLGPAEGLELLVLIPALDGLDVFAEKFGDLAIGEEAVAF